LPARRHLSRIFLSIAVEVLTDVAGRIPGVAEPHGEGVAGVEPDEAARGRPVATNAVVV